jgi:hypothetical protein
MAARSLPIASPFRSARTLSALLLLGCALGLLITSPCRAQEIRRHQIWVFVHVTDHKSKSHESVDIQIPLEWVRKSHLTRCDDDSKGIDGEEIYRRYKNLPPGEEAQAEKLECHDSDITVRVANREVEEGPRARRLRVLAHESDEDHNVDITVPFGTLSSLGNLLSGHWLTFEDSNEQHHRHHHEKGNEEELGITDLLRQLPPFRIVEVRGDDKTVEIRSE